MEQKGNGKAIASLVLGIVSLVCAVFGAWLAFVGIILGVVGIVMGVSAKKDGPNGMATAGFVLSIIGVCFNAAIFLVCSCIVGSIASLA